MRSLDELLEEFTKEPLYKTNTMEYTPEAIIAYERLVNLLYDVGELTKSNNMDEILDHLDEIYLNGF